MTISADFWQAIAGAHIQPRRKVEAVRSVPVSGPAFFGCFWVQEETNDPGKLQEELGFLEEPGA